DPAQVVGRMSPFGGEPRVVEVEPADDRAEVEGGLDGIELERGAGDLRAVRDDRAGDDRTEELRACRKAQRLEAAAERVHEAIARGVERLLRGDLVRADVVDDVDQDLVRIRPDVADVRGHAYLRFSIGTKGRFSGPV